MKKNKDPPDSCWRTQSSLCAWFFPPLTCLLGVVSLFDFPIKKSVFLRVKPDICHVWLAYNKMTNPSLQLMKYWLGFLFKRSWRARALLNIGKVRKFVVCYLLFLFELRFLESPRVSMSLHESQWVLVSLSESQWVSMSHGINIMKLIWANKVDLKWSSYFPNF